VFFSAEVLKANVLMGLKLNSCKQTIYAANETIMKNKLLSEGLGLNENDEFYEIKKVDLTENFICEKKEVKDKKIFAVDELTRCNYEDKFRSFLGRQNIQRMEDEAESEILLPEDMEAIEGVEVEVEIQVTEFGAAAEAVEVDTSELGTAAEPVVKNDR
jgi:hypothetical protein